MLFDDWNNGMFMPEIVIKYPIIQFLNKGNTYLSLKGGKSNLFFSKMPTKVTAKIKNHYKILFNMDYELQKETS